MSNLLIFDSRVVRICHLTTVHGRYDVRIFFKECASLASAFKNVSLAVFDGRGCNSSLGIDIVDIGTPPQGRLHRMLSGSLRVLNSSVIARADVVHFHDPELLLVGLLLKLRGKKVIYDAHEDVPRQIENKHWIPVSLRRVVSGLVEAVENFVARRLDAVVTATPLISDRFLKVNPLTTVVRNYPLLEEFLTIPLEKSDSRVVCYVGALTRERGIIELLDALCIIGNVRLTACGPFQSREFESELRQHPGWAFVDYLGIVGRQEVAEVMGKAQIGLVTLLPTPNQVEALPVKMFEYMAAGTPFLASDFPLWQSIAEQSGCGMCVDPENPKMIAEVLVEMLSDRERLRAWGAAGRTAAIERYNWQSESASLIRLYERILHEQKA